MTTCSKSSARLLLVVPLVLAVAPLAASAADDYPNRVIRIIAPTADGGAGSARLGAWMRPDSGMQAPNIEPRSYAHLRGRIPNGAPAPRFGAPPTGTQ